MDQDLHKCFEDTPPSWFVIHFSRRMYVLFPNANFNITLIAGGCCDNKGAIISFVRLRSRQWLYAFIFEMLTDIICTCPVFE